MMALQLSEDRISLMPRRQEIINALHALPGQIQKVLEIDQALQKLAADTLAQSRSLLILGRGLQSALHCSLELTGYN